MFTPKSLAFCVSPSKKEAANIRKYHDHDKHVTELPINHEDWSPF